MPHAQSGLGTYVDWETVAQRKALLAKWQREDEAERFEKLGGLNVLTGEALARARGANRRFHDLLRARRLARRPAGEGTAH